MQNLKNNYKKRNRLSALIACSLTVCILFLTIGFSSFSDNLSIDGAVSIRAQANIRFTNVSVINETNGASSNYEEYYVKSINSAINLPNANSTVTYHIEVTNIGNVKQGIYSINEIYKHVNTNTDSDLEIKNKTVNLKDALCDDANHSQCKLGSITTFDITIGYKDNGYDGTNLAHLIELDFDFRRIFDITYEGFLNVSGLPTQMIYGDTKIITFDNTSGIPSSVVVTGATGNYSSPTLTLSNITISAVDENIVVARAFSVTYIGFSGDTSGLISSVSATGATITFNNITGIPSSVIVSGASSNYANSPNLVLTNVTGDVTITNAYAVTYVDFTGSVSGLPDKISTSGDTITFNSVSGIPTSVTVSGASFNYNSPPNLILTNVTGNVTITATFSGSTQVIDNGDGTITTITETVTENQDGSTTTISNAVTTDNQGNVTSTSETQTIENSNGSSTSTTTNYDAQGNKTTGSTSNTDTSGNTNTQSIAYDANGNSTVTGYSIDTTNNANGGETLDNTSLDTGMIVFDGKGFEMNLVFKTNLKNNAQNNIFGAIETVATSRYSGFIFTVSKVQSNQAQCMLMAGSNTRYYSASGGIGSILHASNSYYSISSANTTKVTEYTIHFKYLPANYGENNTDKPYVSMTFTPIQTSGTYHQTNPFEPTKTEYIPASLNNATFTLGGNGINSATNMTDFEVISFDVHKI